MTMLRNILVRFVPLDIRPLVAEYNSPYIGKFRHPVSFSLLWMLFFWNSPGSAQENPELDLLIRVSSNSKSHELICLDNFSGDTPYHYHRNTSHLQMITYVPVRPDGVVYEKESSAFNGIYPDNLNSLEIQTFIENPNREIISIRPSTPKFFWKGIPVKLSIWVYSNNYSGNLNAIFRNHKNRRIKVELGSLRFEGWSRLEKSFPHLTESRGPVSPFLRKIDFEALEINFQKNQKSGPIVIRFHRSGILLQKYPEYPGDEIMDDWRFK